MQERVRCGPGPPKAQGSQNQVAVMVLCGSFALLESFLAVDHRPHSRRQNSVRSTQAERTQSWRSLHTTLGAPAGAPSILPECTSPMTWPPRSVVQDGSAGHHLVSRDEGQARFQEAPFAIRSERGKERAPSCSAESSAPPHPG